MATHAAASVTREPNARRLRGIYAILDERERMLEVAAAVLDAGVGIVQYRAKAGVNEERLRALRALVRSRDALLILNDDWKMAHALECDGVHIGPDDPGFDDLSTIRSRAPRLLVGLSCGTRTEFARADLGRADYVGIGPVFATASKADAGEPLGVEGFAKLAAACTLPVAAIGGITASTAGAVRSAGAWMAAVIGAVGNAADPRWAAIELIDAWNAAGEGPR